MAICWAVGCAEPPDLPPSPVDLPALPEEVAVAEPGRGPVAASRALRIALVGEVRGEIEPCGCPTLPFGGFSRREKLLERLQLGGTPLLHLDAGETLLKGIASSRSDSARDRAELILELSSAVGVDAWAPGPSDLLALGLEGLQEAAKTHRAPPVVAASWEADGAAVLPRSLVWEQDGLRVGIVGINGPPTGRRDRESVSVVDAVSAARRAIGGLPSGLDLVIVLGSMPESDADAVAAQVDGVAMVLTTRDRVVDAPRQPTRSDGTPGALIVETPDRGRYLQVIDLQLGTTSDGPLLEAPAAAKWKQRDTLRGQLRNARASGSSRVSTLEAQLVDVNGLFDELGAGRNLVNVQTIPLGSDLDDVAAVDGAIDGFKARTLSRAEAVAKTDPGPLEARYAGAGACVNCHTEEFARWGFSGHSGAWHSLVKRQATENPECVGCHTTGFGEPGGLGELTMANIRKFKDVQCEACHGPMAGHPDDPRVSAQPVTAERCLQCHDEANSPAFAFEEYLHRASCQPFERPAAPIP